MILAQAKSAVARLTEKEQRDVFLVAVTLDPENDDPAALKKLADGQGVSAPQWNLCTGDSVSINKALDKMGIERRTDEETGVILHTNLFLVVDRAGKVAFRFSLGDLQEDWLVEALHIVCAEQGPQS